MCIVIDINTIPSVFDPGSSDHDEFANVLRWILDGKGCMLIGGEKYNSELSKLLKKYGPLFTELAKCKKIVTVDKLLVDSKHLEIVAFENKDFDDSHIVSLLAVAGCLLVCTKDERMIKYIKKKEFYGDGQQRKIYMNSSHKHLLNDDNIRGKCLPCRILRANEKPKISA